MADLSLVDLFGVGAYQDIDLIYIKKSSLLNLSPSPNNRAEQLLAALLLQTLLIMSGVLIDESGNTLIDENNAALTFDNSELFTYLSAFQWEVKFVERRETKYVKNTFIFKQYEMV